MLLRMFTWFATGEERCATHVVCDFRNITN